MGTRVDLIGEGSVTTLSFRHHNVRCGPRRSWSPLHCCWRFMKGNTRVAYLLNVPVAVVRAVLNNIINVLSPKHERERQQARCPSDHDPQQKPLIDFHYSVPSQQILNSSCITGQKVMRFHWFRRSPKDETVWPYQFRYNSHLCELY